MQLGVQPVIVGEGTEILDLLNEISLALAHGGVAWIDRAKEKAALEASTSQEAYPEVAP